MRKKLVCLVLLTALLVGVAALTSNAQARGPREVTFEMTVNPVIGGEVIDLVFAIENNTGAEVPFEVALTHRGYWWLSFWPYQLENATQTWVECHFSDCVVTYEGVVPAWDTSEIRTQFTTREIAGTWQDAISMNLNIKRKKPETASINVTLLQP